MYHGYVPGIISLNVIRDENTTATARCNSAVPLRTGAAVHVLFCFLPSGRFFGACFVFCGQRLDLAKKIS